MPISLLHIALVAVIAMWGMVFVAIHEMLRSIDATQLITIRFSMISIVFLLLFAIFPSTRPKISKNDWKLFVVGGLLAVPLCQLPVVDGQRFLSPPLVSLIMSTAPAWAAVLARFFLSERTRLIQIVGFAIAMCGVVLVILIGSSETTDLTIENPLRASVILISPIAWAGYSVVGKAFSERSSPIAITGTTIIFGTIFMLPFWPYSYPALSVLSFGQWMWMIYLTFCGTVITYLVWFYALRVLSTGQTVSYMYGVPLAALLCSWIVLDYIPTASSLGGGAAIIIGVVLTQWGRNRRISKTDKSSI